MAAIFHRDTGLAHVTEDSALPYLDGEALLRECLQIIEETFAYLRCPAPYPPPTTKVVICRVNECEFSIDFAMADLAVHTPANPQACASAILNHYRGSALIVALWCQLATDEFVDLVQRLQQQGIPLVCCHEQHAVFRF